MNNEISSRSYAIKYGSILGVFAFAYGILLQWVELDTERWASSMVFLVMVAAFILAIKEYKNDNGGYMSLGQGFKLSMLIALVYGAISNVLSYLYIKFIDDSTLTRAAEIARAEMEKNPELSDEQIDQVMSMTERFMTPEITAVSGFFMTLVVGAILGLIISAIMKKNPLDSETL